MTPDPPMPPLADGGGDRHGDLEERVRMGVGRQGRAKVHGDVFTIGGDDGLDLECHGGADRLTDGRLIGDGAGGHDGVQIAHVVLAGSVEDNGRAAIENSNSGGIDLGRVRRCLNRLEHEVDLEVIEICESDRASGRGRDGGADAAGAVGNGGGELVIENMNRDGAEDAVGLLKLDVEVGGEVQADVFQGNRGRRQEEPGFDGDHDLAFFADFIEEVLDAGPGLRNFG